MVSLTKPRSTVPPLLKPTTFSYAFRGEPAGDFDDGEDFRPELFGQWNDARHVVAVRVGDSDGIGLLDLVFFRVGRISLDPRI
jgi:hypothetical protein